MTTEAPHIDLGGADAAQLAAARAEERRHAASAVVASLYRLMKVSRIHVESNQAVKSIIETMIATIEAYCEKAESQAVSILFTTDTVFVNGQMLRTSRETYQMAMEFGGWLDKLKLSEVTLSRGLEATNVTAFVRAFMGALRDTSQVAGLATLQIPGVRLRQLRVQGGRDATLEETASGRLVRTYAAAVVVLRGFYEHLERGSATLPTPVKRVAQRLVATAEDGPQALVALTAARGNPKDPASIAVAQALLALLVGRQLTSDRVLLSGLVLGALLADTGSVRLARAPGGALGVRRALSEEDDDRVPVSSVVMMTALGRIHAPSIQRAVIAFEALWTERSARIGAVYGARRPATILARILGVARRFQELLSGRATGSAMSVDDALQQMTVEASDENQRTDVKLLVGALGIFPAGTIVELSTGELAVVLSTPLLPVDFARPPVRIIYDANGQKLPRPLDLDLAAKPGPRDPVRVIRRTVEADEQQMKAMRSYVIGVSAGRRGGKASTGNTASRRPAGDTPPPGSLRTAPPPADRLAGATPVAPPDWEGGGAPNTVVDRRVDTTAGAAAGRAPDAGAATAPPARPAASAPPARAPRREAPSSTAMRAARPVAPPPSTPAPSGAPGSSPPPGLEKGTALGRVKVQRVAVPQATPIVEEQVFAQARPEPTQHVDWSAYNPLVSSSGADAAPSPDSEPPPSRGVAWADGLELVGDEGAGAEHEEEAEQVPPAHATRVASWDEAPRAQGATRVASWDEIAAAADAPSEPPPGDAGATELDWAIPELARAEAPAAETPSQSAATRVVDWESMVDEIRAEFDDGPPTVTAAPASRGKTLRPALGAPPAPNPPMPPASVPKLAVPRPNPDATRVKRWSATDAVLRDLDTPAPPRPAAPPRKDGPKR